VVFARAGRGFIPVCSSGSSIQRPEVIPAAHLSNGRWSSWRLIYPVAGGYPADRSNLETGTCKNPELISTASILATESRGSELTGAAPGDSVLMKSEPLPISSSQVIVLTRGDYRLSRQQGIRCSPLGPFYLSLLWSEPGIAAIEIAR
jgi:hypothetical protein